MEYNLTFFEAVEKCLKDKAVIVAEGFGPGFYAVSENGYITLKTIEENLKTHLTWGALQISESVLERKFKVVPSADAEGLGLDICPYCNGVKYKNEVHCRGTYCKVSYKEEQENKD